MKSSGFPSKNVNKRRTPSAKSNRSFSNTPSNAHPFSENDRKHEYDDKFKNLSYEINDDLSILINKNSKLRQLLIESQARVEELNLKLKNMEERQLIEKNEIYNELERISETYKLYAESHKILNSKSEYYDKALNEHDHNSQLIKFYQDNISLFLIDYIAIFHKMFHHISTYKTTSSTNFVYDLKDIVLTNLIKYKDVVDSFNFPELFEEYKPILENKDRYSFCRPSNSRSKSPSAKSSTSEDKQKSSRVMAPKINTNMQQSSRKFINVSTGSNSTTNQGLIQRIYPPKSNKSSNIIVANSNNTFDIVNSELKSNNHNNIMIGSANDNNSFKRASYSEQRIENMPESSNEPVNLKVRVVKDAYQNKVRNIIL